MRDGKRLNVNPAMYKIISKMDDNVLGGIAAFISKIPTEKVRLTEQKLKQLKNELSVEKEKTSQLQEQLKKNFEITKKFSNLYKDAVSNVPQKDKGFLKVVEGEKRRLNKISSKKNDEEETNFTEEFIKKTVAVKDAIKDDSLGRNKTVEISTNNQVDQIISTINKQITFKPNNKPTSKKIYVSSDSFVKKTVNLQNKINQLVSEKDIPKTQFTQALKAENQIRKNAVRSVVVRKGDTLWSISKRAYGTGFKYNKILMANPSLKKGKVVKILVGQVLRVPE